MNTRFQLLLLLSFLIPLPCGAQSFDLGSTWLLVDQQTNANDTVLSINQEPAGQQLQTRNGLPPVSTDSFVYEAGAMAELIYGDEGLDAPPPFSYFTPEHRIGAGITGLRAEGLTDGRSSPLPTTWGGDEFFEPEPFSSNGQQSGVQPVQQVEQMPEFELAPNWTAAGSATAIQTDSQLTP